MLFEEKMERVRRFERPTPTLARLCSTPELHPLINLGPGVVGGPWRRCVVVCCDDGYMAQTIFKCNREMTVDPIIF